MKRIIALVMAAAMLISALALVSCGNDEPDNTADTTTSPVTPDSGNGQGGDTEPPETEHEFVDADYGGTDFVVYMRSHQVTSYKVLYVTSEEGTDVVSEQSTRRNQMVEEKYKINLVFREVSSPESTLKTDIAGESVDYDIMICQRNKLSNSATGGLLYDFNCLEGVDYTAKWWDANAMEAYTLGDRLFVMPCDVSVANLSACRCMFFSKGLLQDFNLKSPYQYVKENDWTLDRFIELATSVKNDSPEGTLGKYGMLSEIAANRNFIVTGCGIPWVGRDSDGGAVICVAQESYMERLDDIAEKLNKLLNDTQCSISYGDAATIGQIEGNYANNFEKGRALFTQDHFLFTQATIGSSSEFIDMTRGFGIVMNPKYNSDQESYVEKIDNNSAIFCIPNSIQVDKERVGAVMDYWAYVSSGTTMEAYFELTMKTKRASDAETAEMLDTIKNTIGYYISDLYTFFGCVDSIISAVFSGTSASTAAVQQKRAISSSIKQLDNQIMAVKTMYTAVD